jgi:flagellar motor protein MotB
MNMAEVTLAAIILMGSSAASLQIWSISMAEITSAQRRQLALNRIDGELILLQQHWQQISQIGPLAPSCLDASQQLLAKLQQTPQSSGVDRQLSLLNAEDGLLVSIRDQNELSARREQVVKPGALRLCEGA